MATTVAPGSSATFTIGAFGTISLTASAASTGTLTFTAGALDNLRSDAPCGLQSKTYGPFGVPGSVTIAVTSGVVTYDVVYTEGAGAISYSTDGGMDSTSRAMVAKAGTLPIGTYATLDLLAGVDLTLYPAGVRALVGPDSYGQYSEWYSNGVRWRPRSGILAMKNTSGSVSDTVSTEQDVYSVVIPASLIGPNDEVYIEHFWQWPNSATNKTIRVKFGGTVIGSVTATTSASGRGNSRIYMRDSKTAQIFSNSTSALGWGEGNSSGSAPVTATIDTNSDITVSATGQWGTSGAGSNLITLERISVGIKFLH
jgi:hypothetical protein